MHLVNEVALCDLKIATSDEKGGVVQFSGPWWIHANK
jgi:hypothetical protein